MLKNYIAGPFHPSLRHWVDCRIGLEEMSKKLKLLKKIPSPVKFRVPSRQLSIYKGYRLENIQKLKREFFLKEIIIEPSRFLDNFELAL